MVSGVAVDKELLIRLIYEKEGVVARAAKAMNIHKDTAHDWIKKDPEVAEAVRLAREKNKINRNDDREDILIELYAAYKDLVRGRDTTAVLFGLKCLDRWNDKSGDEGQQSTKIETVDYSKAANG